MASIRWVALFVVVGCSDAPAPDAPRPTPRPSVAPTTPTGAAARGYGAPCQESECGSGLCLPLTGGYCTKSCPGAGKCGDDASCVPTVSAGELCLDSCTSNADCRQDQGYECSEDYKACMVPGFIGPKPPSCKGTPPKPRARFSEPTLLSTPPRTAYSFEPTAALLPNGDLVVAYTAMNGIDEPNDLETILVKADGTLGTPHPFGSSKRRHFDPWMTAFDNEVVLVWLGHDGGSPDKDPTIAMSESKDGETWSTPVAIMDDKDCPEAARGCVDKPMVISTGAKKKPALAAFYFSEVTEGLRARASKDGSAFAPSNGILKGAYGDVFADERGGLHVVAQTFTAGDGAPDRFGDKRGIVEYATSTDGGAKWSSPLQVSADTDAVPFYFSNPQVVYDARRNRLHVLYPTGTADGRWDIVLRSSSDRGKSWATSRVNDDVQCANHMKPSAALDPKTGELYVMWADNRDSKGRMVLSTCNGATGKEAKCTEAEAISAPFASYGFVRHAPAWLGEYDVLLFDEQRRVLHAVFTAPIDEKGVATSRIHYARAKM